MKYKIFKFRYIDKETGLKFNVYARNEETANKIIEIENDGSSFTFVPRFRFKRKVLFDTPPDEAEEIQFETVKQRREYRIKNKTGIYKT